MLAWSFLQTWVTAYKATSWPMGNSESLKDLRAKQCVGGLRLKEKWSREFVEERSRASSIPGEYLYDVFYLHLHLLGMLVAFSLSGRG